MPARTALPLFLLMLVWTLPARVHCQTLEASLVSTQYVEVTWKRELQWYGVNEFQVVSSSQVDNDCHQSVACSTQTCSFDSTVCGLIQPCTPTSITVSGDNYTAPSLVLVTGPESVTNMTLRLEEGVQYISWVNPSNDSSHCYERTAVRISFNDEIYTDYFAPNNESTSKALCVSGYGEVEVWSEGGDGHSISSWGTIVYNGSEVVDLLTFGTCEAAGCTSLAMNWSYAPVCPDVAYFSLTMLENTRELQDRSVPDFSLDVLINTTSTTVTDLGYDRVYYTCIIAMNTDGEELARSCSDSCRTPYVVPQNLTVQPLSDSTLRATWEPPVCQPEPRIEYKLNANNQNYYTFNTTYDVGGLMSFYLYKFMLEVNGYGNYYYDQSCTLFEEECTKLEAPNVWRVDVYQSYVTVDWELYVPHSWGYEIYYKVTWGSYLQFYGETEEQSFFIMNLNDTDEVVQVCVAAAVRGRKDLTSQIDCENATVIALPESRSGMEGWKIAVIVVGVCLLAVVITAAVVYKLKKSKVQKRRRQQQQQRQQDEPPPYMDAINNPGTTF